MRERPQLLITQTDSIDSSTFIVASTIDPVDGQTPMDVDNLDKIYHEDASLGSILFGWGILKMLVAKGKQGVIILHKGDDYSLPGNNTED